MKYGKIIEGNVRIEKGCTDDFSEVIEIKGYLYIHSNAKLEASNLQTVGGNLSIYSNAKLEALQTVGGNLSIYSNAKLEALQTVGGYLSIHSNAKLKASNLQTVGGYLSIHSNAKLKASNLQTVGGNLSIYSNAKLEALQTVGGYLSIHSNAKLEAPKAKYKVENAKKLAFEFNFNCFLNLGYLFADGILAKILHKRQNIYKIQIVGQTKASYCVEVDGSFSHGETIKEAKEDLIYKISHRDTSMYNDFTLDTVVTYPEAIAMYRTITGACKEGTKHFCTTGLKVKKDKYTVKEVIELTKGQYNSNLLQDFFSSKV